MSKLGLILPGNVGGGPGSAYADQQPGNMLANGIETLPRDTVTSQFALTSQRLCLRYFTARKSFLSSQAVTFAGTVAAGATPTLCRYGLFSIAANGNGSLVAATDNDTSIWAATFGVYARPWQAPVQLALGQRYAFGILIVSAAAMPNVVSSATAGNNSTIAQRAPRLQAAITGQSDLPASFTEAALSNLAAGLYAEVLP